MIQPIRPQDASGIYQRQVSQARDASDVAASRTDATRASGSSRRADRVAVSDEARTFARVMQAVTEAPDIRADRVAKLRERIASGDYRVEADALARLLVDRGVQG